MTRNELLIVGGLLGLGALFVGTKILGRGDVANWQGDPDLGRHRGLPYQSSPGQGTGAPLRAASAQDPKPAADFDGYPYRGDMTPGKYAQGFPGGRAMNPIGYSPLDYGRAPQRIPRLWKDYTRYWDGVMQHGFSQQNYRVFLFHLRPSMPTRGFRSVSGVLYNGGPTASRVRIPAVFVPSAVN